MRHLQKILLAAAAASEAAAAAAVGPPAQPSWPSPLPKFPSSWFGANTKSYELDDPKELAVLRQFSQVLASWPELTLASNFTNGTAIAVLSPQFLNFQQKMWQTPLTCDFLDICIEVRNCGEIRSRMPRA